MTHSLLARDFKRNLTTFLQVDPKMTNLDLTLQDGMTLSTKVSDTDGRLLTNATATVSIRLGTMGFGIDPQPIMTDKHGELRITALPQGQRYMVQFHAPGHTSFMRRIEADETATNVLELPPVVLTAMDRDVAGQVLDNDGEPAVGSLGAFVPRRGPDDYN